MSLVEQELYTIPEYQSSPLVYRIFSFLCSVLCKIVCFSFLLAIALLVLLRFTASNYPFENFKLFNANVTTCLLIGMSNLKQAEVFIKTINEKLAEMKPAVP